MKRKMSKRAVRVADQVAHEIALIMRTKAADVNFQKATVTGAEISGDLKIARIFVSIFEDDPEECDKIIIGFNHAAGFFRSEIGRRLHLKFTPEIHFERDRVYENARRILSTLDALSGEQHEGPDQDIS